MKLEDAGLQLFTRAPAIGCALSQPALAPQGACGGEARFIATATPNPTDARTKWLATCRRLQRRKPLTLIARLVEYQGIGVTACGENDLFEGVIKLSLKIWNPPSGSVRAQA